MNTDKPYIIYEYEVYIKHDSELMKMFQHHIARDKSSGKYDTYNDDAETYDKLTFDDSEIYLCFDPSINTRNIGITALKFASFKESPQYGVSRRYLRSLVDKLLKDDEFYELLIGNLEKVSRKLWTDRDMTDVLCKN